MANGKEKIIADVPADIKEKLKEMAHVNRSDMTKELIRLIEEAPIKLNKKANK